MPLTISNTVKTYPKLPYQKIAEAILGKRYAVSLVFIGEKRAQKLNEETRGKTYVANVLSFPLSDTTGEIFIAPSTASREAENFDLSEAGYVGYLFIHGCLHLKGLDHGDKMDKLEQKFLTAFKLK